MGNSTQQNEVNGGTPLAEPTGSRMVVTQEMVDAIVKRAKASECGLEEPDKGADSYKIDQYSPQSLHSLAIMLVSAHFSKWDIISVMTAALEEVADRCANTRRD